MTAQPRRLLLTTDAVGGVWQYSTELAHALAPLGFETVLVLTGPAPSAAQRATATRCGVTLLDAGVDLDWLAPDAAAIADGARRIAELAGDCHADVIQLNAPSLAAGVHFPAPVVTVAHSCVATWWQAVEGGVLPVDFAWRAAVTGEGLRAADAVIAPSAAFAEATQRAYSLPARPLVVHNGRALPVVAPVTMQDFALTAGRLWDRGKDLATLDRAAARMTVPLLAAGPICGPNGETARFDHADAIGVLDEAALGARLAARPVFVSAARYEPFGLAVLEAAAVGCALVLADTPTFRELWDGAAHFVTLGDAAGFAAAIEAIVGDTPRRLALGSAAQARAARYTPAATAAAMAGIYAGLLRRPGRRWRREDRLFHPLADLVLEPRQRAFPTRRIK